MDGLVFDKLHTGQTGSYFSVRLFMVDVRTKMKRKGISQKRLAKQLGVSAPLVSKWFTGKGVPALQDVVHMAWIFQIDWMSFMFVTAEDDNFVNEVRYG